MLRPRVASSRCRLREVRGDQDGVVEPDQIGRPLLAFGGLDHVVIPRRSPPAAGVAITSASSISAQAVLRWSTPSGVSTMRGGAAELAEHRRSASRRAGRCGRTGRSGFRREGSECRRRRRNPSSSSSTMLEAARSTGAISAASPIRVGAPGLSRIAPSGRTKAGSSTNTEIRISLERRQRLYREASRFERRDISLILGQHPA